MKKINVSIVIVSYNTQKILLDCLDSIIKNTKDLSYEIIVVDNGSTDGSIETLKSYFINHQSLIINHKLIVNQRNLGFAAANNQGTKKAHGEFILYLNSDTVIQDNVIGEMVVWMKKHLQVGAATCSLRNKDNSLQGTGGYFPTLLRVFSWMFVQDLPLVDRFIKPFHPMKEKSIFKGTNFYKHEKELDWVTGAFFLARKEAVEKAGGWDEKYFMYTEEVDLCYRLKKLGHQIWYLPKWSIIHLGGASGTREAAIISEFFGTKRFYQKYFPAWQLPVLRLFLKLGALGRAAIFSILEGSDAAKIYTKVFFEI